MTDTVLIDAGSTRVRVGLVGDTAPRAVVPTTAAGGQPIKGGQIVDAAAWGALVNYLTTSVLGLDPMNCEYLVSVSPGSGKAVRQSAVTAIVTGLRAYAAHVASSPSFGLLSQGFDAAVVIDIGHELTSITPVQRDASIGMNLTLPLSGREIELNLQTLLAKRGTQVDQATARALKEALCYVAPDSWQADDGPCQGPGSTSVSGKSYTLAEERYRATEILFRPQLAGSSSEGLAPLAYQAIMGSDPYFRKTFAANVLLCGGGSRIPGLAERLQHDLEPILPGSVRPTVTVTPDSDVLTWKGMHARAQTMGPDEWVMQVQLNDRGPIVVDQKCLF